MYRILIEDDEGIVTDSLQFIIEKNFGDECRTAIAKNGRQAIELADAFQPDIVFLDIQMPGINGLKALEEIRGLNPKAKTLILTAYDNFDYAKEALRLGAVDYLMKPIGKNVVVERLTGIMREIDAERQKRSDELKIREKMETVTPFIENGFVLSLIIQSGHGENGEQYRRLLDIGESYGSIMALEWGGGNAGGPMRNPVGSGIRAQRSYGKIAEIIKVYFRACVSGIIGDMIVCVIPSKEPEMDYTERLRMIEKARGMLSSMKKAVGIDFKAGIGSVRPWETMFESYQEALNALRHGKREVTHTDDLIVTDARKKELQAMEQAVLRAVTGGIEYDARNEAAVFSSWLMKNKSYTFEDARLKMTELYLLAVSAVAEQGGCCPDEQETLNALVSARNFEELSPRFVGAMTRLAQAAVIQEKDNDGIIARSKDYIRKNFRHDLPLEDVAMAVGISPYYFSKLFKEETGTNFTEYLTGLRIERAKQLLTNPKISIKQVCLDSGYSNPNYFSRIFKKWTGITPTEFREGLRA